MTSTNRHVLVVEDDSAVRRLETTILRSAGYDVEQAADGAAALDAAARRRPDLIVLDLVMPGLDGWGVLERVSAQAEPPPVIVVSGRYETVPPGRLSRCLTGYVRKPFAAGQLLSACAAALKEPPVVPAADSRREPRRTFVTEAIVLSESGAPAMHGNLRQVSRQGFQLEARVTVRPGDPVRIEFQIPGQQEPLQLAGLVRWQAGSKLGAEIEHVSPPDRAALQALVAGRQEAATPA